MRKDIPNSLSFQISASTNVEELLRQTNVEIGDWLLVVIDEFGPLEANGLGLRTAIDSVLQSRCRTLVVVREQLLETAHALFAPISVMRIFPSAGNT
jgi:nucleoside-triphosphatase THEP1